VASKGLLPYHGRGSGIRRAIAAWQKIDFVDDRDRNQFSVVVYRPPGMESQLPSQPLRYDGTAHPAMSS
jgi:ATP-dependent DNA helicase RecG